MDDIKSKIGLLDAAIVFAPSDNVTELAINSVKKGGLVVIATKKLILQSWNNPPFDSCEDRTFITHHIRQNLTLY